MREWRQEAIKLKERGVGIREISRTLKRPYTSVWEALNTKERVKEHSVFKIDTNPKAEGPTIIFLPDAQVKPGVDLTYLRCQGEYIAQKKPDVIVCAGDFADMESLSTYDKGKKSAEGKRVAKDIEAAIKGMEALLTPVKLTQICHPEWKPRLVLTLGNHECLKPDVEVLTKRGFIKITAVNSEDLIAQRGVDGKTVWGRAEGFVSKEYDGPMYNWSGQSFELSCTENHRVLRKTSGGNAIYSLAKEVPQCFEIYSSTSNSSEGITYSDAQICLGAWLCTDSFFTKHNQVVLYQRESNAHKIEQLLNTLSIKFKKTIRDRDIKEICGKKLKQRCEKGVEFYLDKSVAHVLSVFSNKQLPEWAWDLNEDQWKVFLDTLIEADGTIPTKSKESLVFYGKYEICSGLQAISVTKGWSASLTEYRDGQWRVNLVKRLSRRQERAEKAINKYKGVVHCLVMPEGNFIIRDNNKVHVTGNCRIDRHVEANPELHGFLSCDTLRYKEFGWEVYDFLKPVVIGGVTFIHYFPNPMTGKPLGGNALSILKTVGGSIVQGHRQTLDVATRTLHTGVQQWSIVAGASYDFDESYKGFTGNKHWRGIVVMHNVKNGGFDPLFVSTDYLKERFA